jgi:protein tyrosine/serine phosphatase
MIRTLAILGILLVVVGAPLAHRKYANVQTRNLRAVTPGIIYRSGQMSEDGLERTLDEYGIRTVISFRDTRDFEEPLCESKGVKYYRLEPLNWSAPDGSVPAQKNVDRFLEITKNCPKPVLVHCFAGIHRTGAFTAIYRMQYQGWSNREAITEMLEIGGLRHSFENDQLEYLERFAPKQ